VNVVTLLSVWRKIAHSLLQLRIVAVLLVCSGCGGLMQPEPEGPSEHEGVGRGGSEYEAGDQPGDFGGRKKKESWALYIS